MSDFWKEIWDSKGLGESNDLLFLDGYEHLEIKADSKVICKGISDTLKINEGESILEVGCGAGFLARELSIKYEYVGVDYSQPLIEKHKSLFPEHKIQCSEAINLPFPDKYFDYTFCFGVYQYLPDDEYAIGMIKEMERVSKKGILLGDLKEDATREQHLPCPKNKIKDLGFKEVDSFYISGDCYRYNAYKEYINDLE